MALVEMGHPAVDAMLGGHVGCVEELIRAGATSFGEAELWWRSQLQSCSCELVGMLLKNGVGTGSPSKHLNMQARLFTWAVGLNRPDIVRMLVHKG